MVEVLPLLRSRPPGQARSTPAIALADTALLRPAHLDGVEIAVATASHRSFPTHVSTSLGVCVKVGDEHNVVADGRRVTYPRDAVCVRPIGCVWASEPGTYGFVSIDISPRLVPETTVVQHMRFAPRSELVPIARLASALSTAESTLHTEQLVTQLLNALSVAGLASSEPPLGGARGAVDAARDYLAAHVTGRPTLEEAAQAAGVDKFTLLRRFKQALDTTPHAYLVMLRLARAQSRLAAGAPVGEAAYESGFADQSHLGRWFVRLHGITPAEYARQVRVAISFQTEPWSA